MTSHPRIVIPILAVLAGGLSYAIFDPIRSFFVKSKASSLFSVEKYRITEWLKRETVGRLGNIDLRLSNLGIALGTGGSRGRTGGESVVGTGIERERMDAAEQLRTWLNDMPDTFVTVTWVLQSSSPARARHYTDIPASQWPAGFWKERARLLSHLFLEVSHT